MIDIAERKRAEDALARSLAEQKALCRADGPAIQGSEPIMKRRTFLKGSALAGPQSGLTPQDVLLDAVIIADTAWYQREESGRRMVEERQAAFVKRYGFPSDSILSQEFLTDEQLLFLAKRFNLHWQVHSPYYGIRWTMRPLLARSFSPLEVNPSLRRDVGIFPQVPTSVEQGMGIGRV